MTIKEEWDKAFETIIPVASLGLGIFSTGMSIAALYRYGPLAQRVFYEDSQLLVAVRYPGQRTDIRDFVQPDNPDVLAVYAESGPNIWSSLDWVCRNIGYRHDMAEFWQFPSETLARREGDCEDASILLCSLLENFTDGYVVLGSYQGYGHAWCQSNSHILETTFTSAQAVPDPQNYCPYVLFNQDKVIEVWSGALDEIFKLRRNEATKLNLLSVVLGVC